MSIRDAAEKRTSGSNENARSEVWISRDVDIFRNSGFSAVFAIAIVAPWNYGGWEIDNSKPFSTIFEISTRRPNSAAINNYFVSADGQWFRLDAAIKGLVHLAPLGISP